MSDRENCKDCKWIESTHVPNQYVCSHPVPFWALPPSIVHIDRLITCPVFAGPYDDQDD